MIDGEDIPDEHLLIKPEYEWESMKIGASGIPIPTDDGWLMFYHAVDRKGVYRVGLMLLDRQNPAESAGSFSAARHAAGRHVRTERGLPELRVPCANVVVGDEIFIYYGAADLYCCLATVKLQEALNYINQYRTNGKKS